MSYLYIVLPYMTVYIFSYYGTFCLQACQIASTIAPLVPERLLKEKDTVNVCGMECTTR